jgi:tripartite-type tricarboxylate transporter receptor subunit TctC
VKLALGRFVFIAVVALIETGSADPAPAQEYYKGKTVTIFAGRPPGGGVDSEMRLVAQFLANHIPGRNMPGAGGVALGNHLFGVAAPDGLTLGVPGRTAFLLAPVTGNPNARYDLKKLTWIGSAASSNFILWLRRGVNVTTLDVQMLYGRRQQTTILAGSGLEVPVTSGFSTTLTERGTIWVDTTPA